MISEAGSSYPLFRSLVPRTRNGLEKLLIRYVEIASRVQDGFVRGVMSWPLLIPPTVSEVVHNGRPASYLTRTTLRHLPPPPPPTIDLLASPRGPFIQITRDVRLRLGNTAGKASLTRTTRTEYKIGG